MISCQEVVCQVLVRSVLCQVLVIFTEYSNEIDIQKWEKLRKVDRCLFSLEKKIYTINNPVDMICNFATILQLVKR